jgi:hypothetical protein
LVFFSIFKAIEGTGLSIWIRESDSVFSFWLILSVHAIGMGVAVGASVLIELGNSRSRAGPAIGLAQEVFPLYMGSGYRWYPARFS